ncbi:MAG: DNA primase DnaG [Candidatus Undinarchaeales archaeon]
MGKVGLAAVKYRIKAKIKAEGVVEKPDVIGAVFGQTEGLLGEDLDLRELQKGGRVGRIEVDISSKEGKSSGTIDIPTSLSKEDTALMAAALETIERVGPCEAEITVEMIEDVRSSKRDYVVDRAKALVGKLGEKVPESQELSELVKEKARVSELSEYGPDKLPVGPNIEIYEDIILVEGRADVLNLLKHGIMNVVGVGGTSVPKSAKKLCKGKTITVFVDGDRGGDLILKKLNQMVDVKFVAKAPAGKEVEELAQKEIIMTLRNKMPLKEALKKGPSKSKKKKSKKKSSKKKSRKKKSRKKSKKKSSKKSDDRPDFSEIVDASEDLESGQALLFKREKKKFKEIGAVPVEDVKDVLDNLSDKSASLLIVDATISQSLVDKAAEKGLDYLIGQKKERNLKRKSGIYVYDLPYLERVVEKE